ncbi:MAG: YkgJ family cysteine cluster protein [Bdellovibrionota bacterium]
MSWFDNLIGKNVRRAWVVIRIFPPFFKALPTRNGLLTHSGRLLIWGKMRRTFLSLSPKLCKKLRVHYGIEGGCVSCGASCNLMFQCPHWNPETRLCGVYEDRPNICRVFPITPADIRDRTLVKPEVPCGFTVTAKH